MYTLWLVLKGLTEKIRNIFKWGYKNTWLDFDDICDDDSNGEYKDWF